MSSSCRYKIYPEFPFLHLGNCLWRKITILILSHPTNTNFVTTQNHWLGVTQIFRTTEHINYALNIHVMTTIYCYISL